MSGISGISGNYAMMMQGMGSMKRPDPTEMADKLFSKLDTSGQGYIQKSDLQNAFDKVSSSSSSGSSSNVDDMFSQLDSNGDGKVTKDEFSSTLKKLADQLDSQFNNMRMSGGMGDMGGLSKDQLTSLSSGLSSSDSTASNKINDLVKNFDKADTDGDGKVSFQEAMAYDKKVESTSSTSATSSSSSNDVNTKLLAQIEKLMKAYGIGDNQPSIDSLLSSISTSA